MTAHVIAIENLTPFLELANPHDAEQFEFPQPSSRWHCSCGRVGEWKSTVGRTVTLGRNHGRPHRSAERRARDGGARHVAAMERRP